MVSEDEIIRIVQSYLAERRYALAAMQDMQHAFNYILELGLTRLAEHLNCGAAQLYSMATFYKALSLKPKGKHIIKICNGTACHIRGSVKAAALSTTAPSRPFRRAVRRAVASPKACWICRWTSTC